MRYSVATQNVLPKEPQRDGYRPNHSWKLVQKPDTTNYMTASGRAS